MSRIHDEYMSGDSLDEKLTELLDQCHLNLCNAKVGEESAVILKHFVEQIKAAFADANYVQIPQTEVVTRYERGKPPEVYMVNGKEVLSGAEWYSRFEKELEPLLTYPIENDGTVNRDLIKKDSVYIAAKRAAGIEEQAE